MRRLAWIAPLVALGLAACGSMSDEERFSLTTPGTDDLVVREVGGSEKPAGKPTKREVAVIRGWADALRTGHVNQAARYFAVGALVLDGTNPRRELPDVDAIRDFNRGLPCGARLIGTKRGEGLFVIARFRLTQRTGPGARPCAGAGSQAETIFLIEKRRIVQWLRQPDPVAPPDRDTS